MTQLTSWTLIKDAASGDGAARTGFTKRFLPVVRAYLGARWRGTPFLGELDDATQEVFLDCFKEGGALERVDPGHGGRFRSFLFGMVRNVALRIETRRAREREQRPSTSFRVSQQPDEEARLSRIFDRAWAQAIMEEAAELQMTRAEQEGGGKRRRVELLRLRFNDGIPIRDVAKLWEEDPAKLHHEYAKARQEFREVLWEVVAQHHCCPPEKLDDECAQLLALLKQ